MPEWKASSWWVARVPMIVIVGLAAYAFGRCVSISGQDAIFSETLSPNRQRKVLMSAGDAGATGYSTLMSADIVAADATGPKGGCRILVASTHAYLDGWKIGVTWLDDSHVVLTYSERVLPEEPRTSCGDIEVTHLISPMDAGRKDAG
jgi:hypothetical protein